MSSEASSSTGTARNEAAPSRSASCWVSGCCAHLQGHRARAGGWAVCSRAPIGWQGWPHQHCRLLPATHRSASATAVRPDLRTRPQSARSVGTAQSAGDALMSLRSGDRSNVRASAAAAPNGRAILRRQGGREGRQKALRRGARRQPCVARAARLPAHLSDVAMGKGDADSACRSAGDALPVAAPATAWARDCTSMAPQRMARVMGYAEKGTRTVELGWGWPVMKQ